MAIIFFDFVDLVNHDTLQACLPHKNNQNKELKRNPISQNRFRFTVLYPKIENKNKTY